jgi:hypothetical protein
MGRGLLAETCECSAQWGVGAHNIKRSQVAINQLKAVMEKKSA